MIVEQPLPIGFEITIRQADEEARTAKQKKSVIYTVVANYKHHVLLVNEYGIRRCMTNAELLTRGLVQQKLEKNILQPEKKRDRDYRTY